MNKKPDEEEKNRQLFSGFFKIGLFSFGGGYAMIPLIQREIVEKKKWLTQEDMLEIIAIAESSPGPIAINAATFTGYRVSGFFGALSATLGVVLPSYVIIICISTVLGAFQNMRVVQYAFEGVRAGVLALIMKALWSMYRQCPKNGFSYVIMAAAFLATAFLHVNVIFVIIGCAIFGLVQTLLAAGREKA